MRTYNNFVLTNKGILKHSLERCFGGQFELLLLRCPSLVRLSLNNNKLANRLQDIATALESNTTLRYLSLRHNRIQDTSPLGAALVVNRTLRDLHLGQNNITECPSLIQAVRANRDLRLYLMGNPIGVFILGRNKIWLRGAGIPEM